MKFNGIKGYCDDQFEMVYKNFKSNFEMRCELGASICVYHKNKIVVNLWSGYKDINKTKAWEESTVVPMFSTSKLVSSACLALCHSKGLFKYDEKVSKYWPEFSENNKQDITISDMLHHRAGLAVIDTKLTVDILNDYDQLDVILAKQKPAWTPGDYQGYHAWSIGLYMSALLCRIDPKKRRVKEFVEEEFVPLLEGDLRIGINDDYDLSNIATLDSFSKLRGMSMMNFKFVRQFFMPWSITFKSMLNPSFVANHSHFNLEEILKLDFGSGGGIGSAKGLSSLMDKLFFDKTSAISLNKVTIDIFKSYPSPPKKTLEDIILKEEGFTFSYGVMKPNIKHNFSNKQTAFGGFGAGGSFVIVDIDNELIISYTMNKMGEAMMNGDREMAIRNAVYNSIKNK